MMWWTLGAALAWDMADAGQAVPGATRAVVVVTPGVQPQATLTWVETLEAEGLDAWTATQPSEGQTLQETVDGLAAVLELQERELVVAAHGYAGVLVLLSGYEPARLALVGTPLAAQVAPTVARHPGEVVSEGFPFPAELTGALPMSPYSGALGGAYLAWVTDYPELSTPTMPTLVVGSNADPIAPPETCRLPSRDWPEREWHRAGMLGVAEEDLSHAELLSDRRVAGMVARFLAEP